MIVGRISCRHRQSPRAARRAWSISSRLTHWSRWASGWGYSPNGANISADNYKLVATPWPRQAPRREEDPTLYRLDKPDAGTGIATAGSEAGASVRIVSAQAAVSTAGGTLVRVGERPMGTFPESKPYPPSF